MTAENERPVEALFSYGPYPPLRDRVVVRLQLQPVVTIRRSS
jgi:hypothetical protein